MGSADEGFCHQGRRDDGPLLRIGTEYLASVVDHFDLIVKDAEEKLSGVEFDTFVGTGLSGALVVPRLADIFGKTWLMIRKPAIDGEHSSFIAEGKTGERWVFVDDKVVTGATHGRVIEIMDRIAVTSGFRLTEVGCYEYHNKLWRPV